MKTINPILAARLVLRPMAALLMLGMAGSVFAATSESETDIECTTADEAARRCKVRADVRDNPHAQISFGDGSPEAALAEGEGSIAIGSGALAREVSDMGLAMAIGDHAQSTGWNSMALGTLSEATSMGSIAIGHDAKVLHNSGEAYLGAMDGIAIGSGATVGQNTAGDVLRETDADGGVALGTNSWAAGRESVALGSGSQSLEERTVSVGTDTNTRRVVNMGAGINLRDAVNVAQLRATTEALGGGAGLYGCYVADLSECIGKTGDFIAPTYTIQGGDVHTVGDALQALDLGLTEAGDKLQATNDRVDQLVADGGSAGDDLVVQDGATGELLVGKQAGGNLIDFAGQDGARVLTGVAGGRIEAGSQEAINGGQLAAIRDELSGRVDDVTGRVQDLEASAALPGDPVEVPNPGLGNDAGGKPISNVGDGVAASDAATVGQVSSQVAQAVSTAKSYTDERVNALSDTLDNFKGEVNDRFSRQDTRMNQMGAMSAANSQMAINAAGVGIGKGRVAVGVGMQSDQKALSIGYAKAINEKVRLSVGGSFSGSQNSVGAGFGVDL